MTTTTKPTPAAMRAAEAVYREAAYCDGFRETEGYDAHAAALAIDRETGLPELLEALESMRCTVCDELIGVIFPPGIGSCVGCHAARAALAKARG